jgi:hypothetical protein
MADPVEVLLGKINDLQRQIQELATRGIIIPVLNTAPNTAYPGNIWMYPDGKLNIRDKTGTIKQVALGSASAPTGTNPTPPPQPKTYTSTYRATWGQAYRSAGGPTGGDDRMLYHGNSGESSYNGRQHSLIGFAYSTIASNLAGSTIKKCEFWIYQVHTYWNNGATLWIGAHNNASQPGTYGGIVHDQISSFHVNPGQAAWHTVSTEYGSRLRDGTAKGVSLTAPSDDRTYYGYAHGGSGTPTEQMPMLRITYVK